MTKDSGCDVFVAESTRSGLQSPTPDLESVAELALRGRREPVRLAGIRIGHGRLGGHELV